jgi:hypothetical protein
VVARDAPAQGSDLVCRFAQRRGGRLGDVDADRRVGQRPLVESGLDAVGAVVVSLPPVDQRPTSSEPAQSRSGGSVPGRLQQPMDRWAGCFRR